MKTWTANPTQNATPQVSPKTGNPTFTARLESVMVLKAFAQIPIPCLINRSSVSDPDTRFSGLPVTGRRGDDMERG
jgi:hypothetical protein